MSFCIYPKDRIRSSFRYSKIILIGFFSGLIGWAGPAKAQVDGLRSYGPSPAAASLVKVEDVPVGLYTGTPQFALPLHTVTGRTLSLPVTLSHHGGAARPADRAGWVGLSWTLSAGGVITRTVRGIPDETAQGYANKEGELRSAYGAQGTTQAYLDNPGNHVHAFEQLGDADPGTYVQGGRLYVSYQQIDPEPDIFFFNFAGRTGRLILSPSQEPGTCAEVTTIPLQDLKITCQTTNAGSYQGNPYYGGKVISQWTVVTEEGASYHFNEVETTRFGVTGSGASGDATYATSWYLTEIESAFGDTIALTYKALRQSGAEYVGAKSKSKVDPIIQDHPVCTSSGSESTPVTWHYEKFLQKIESATERITFATSLRDDALSPAGVRQTFKLDRIEVRSLPSGLKRKTYAFDYGYFVGRGPELHSDDGTQLRLDAVREETAGEVPLVHAFDYYEGPAAGDLRSRYTDGLDHWGYYNGKENQNDGLIPYVDFEYGGRTYSLDGANREPGLLSHLLPGALKQVIYPTGGYTAFEYEPHDYGYLSYGAVNASDSYTNSESAGGSSDPVTRRAVRTFLSEPFTVGLLEDAGGNAVSSVNPTLTYSNIRGGSSAICAPDKPCAKVFIDNLTDGVHRQDPEVTSENFWPGGKLNAFDLEAGKTYRLRIKLGFTYNDQSCALATCGLPWSINLSWRERRVTKTRAGGGLRVKKITQHDGIDAARDVVKRFAYTMEQEPDRSSGQLLSVPRYHTVTGMGISSTSGPTSSESCHFLTREGTPIAPLGSNLPSTITYKEVTVLYGEEGEHGQSRHTFTGYDWDSYRTTEYQRDPLAQRTADMLPYDMKILRPWRYGLTLSETHRDAASTKRAETLTSHLMSDIDRRGEPERFKRLLGLRVGPAFTLSSGNSATWYAWYEVASSHSHPETVTVRQYGTDGTSHVTTTSTRRHESPLHLQPTSMREALEDGTERVTEYEYAHEQAAYADMDKDGMHLLAPIYRTTVTDGSEVLSRSWTTFNTSGSDKGLPEASWAWTGEAAVPDAPGGASTLRQAAFAAYDVGRPTELVDARGFSTLLTYGGAGAPSGSDAYLTRVEKEGLSVGYGYDDLGRLQTMEGEDSLRTCFDYDGLGRLVQTRRLASGEGGDCLGAAAGEPLSAYTYYHYDDALGDVAAAPSFVKTTLYGGASPDQVSTSFLDGLGRPFQVQTKDEGGQYVVQMTDYDERGRPHRVWKPFRYATGGAVLDSATARGEARSFYGDQKPYAETRYEASPLGRALEAIHPGGAARVTTAYDVSADLLTTRVTSEEGRIGVSYADGFGRQTRAVAGVGTAEAAETAFSYDVLGRLLETLPPNAATLPHAGDTPEGWATTYRYDALGRLLAKATPDADGDGDEDPTDERAGASGGSGGTPVDYRYAYDASGNLRFSQDPNQRQVQANGGTGGGERVFFTGYDALDRPVYTGEAEASFEALDPEQAAPYAFEDDEANRRSAYAYDAAPSLATYPWDTRADDFSHDPLEHTTGRLAAEATRLGLPGTGGTGEVCRLDGGDLVGTGTTETHEATGRLEAGPFTVADGGEVTLRAGEAIVLKPGFAARLGAKLLVEVDPSLIVASGDCVGDGGEGLWQLAFYSYDARGRLADEYVYAPSRPRLHLAYGYDRQDRLVKRTARLGEDGEAETFYQWYGYDARGLLTAVYAATTDQQPTTPEVSYAYTATGQADDLTYRDGAGGTVLAYDYDRLRDWLTEIGDVEATGGGSGDLFAAAYGHDLSGNVAVSDYRNPAAVEGSTEPERYRYRYRYGYDGLSRLKRADCERYFGSGSWQGYDCSVGGDASGGTISYDKSGNLLSLNRSLLGGTAHALTYDYQAQTPGSSRLDRVTNASDGSQAIYSYDASGNVVSVHR